MGSEVRLIYLLRDHILAGDGDSSGRLGGGDRSGRHGVLSRGRAVRSASKLMAELFGQSSSGNVVGFRAWDWEVNVAMSSRVICCMLGD